MINYLWNAEYNWLEQLIIKLDDYTPHRQPLSLCPLNILKGTFTISKLVKESI